MTWLAYLHAPATVKHLRLLEPSLRGLDAGRPIQPAFSGAASCSAGNLGLVPVFVNGDGQQAAE